MKRFKMIIFHKFKQVCSICVFSIVSLYLMSSNLLASVNPDGSFSYKIDIKLPPGTKGMQPDLELVYNSNAKNSIIGMGWYIAGIPAITRDSSYAINYDGNDSYIGPNGQLISGGGSTIIRRKIFPVLRLLDPMETDPNTG